MPEYIYMIRPTRPGFFKESTPEEDQVMAAHFGYLKAGVESGTVFLAGPCLDETFGLVVFQAESDEAAEGFMNNDPSVVTGVMQAELHPFRVSLMHGKV